MPRPWSSGAKTWGSSTSNLKFAVGCQEFRVRCTKKDPAEVPQTQALEFGEAAANFGFGVLARRVSSRQALVRWDTQGLCCACGRRIPQVGRSRHGGAGAGRRRVRRFASDCFGRVACGDRARISCRLAPAPCGVRLPPGRKRRRTPPLRGLDPARTGPWARASARPARPRSTLWLPRRQAHHQPPPLWGQPRKTIAQPLIPRAKAGILGIHREKCPAAGLPG